MNPVMFEMLAHEKLNDLRNEWYDSRTVNSSEARPGFLIRLSSRFSRRSRKAETKPTIKAVQIEDCG